MAWPLASRQSPGATTLTVLGSTGIRDRKLPHIRWIPEMVQCRLPLHWLETVTVYADVPLRIPQALHDHECPPPWAGAAGGGGGAGCAAAKRRMVIEAANAMSHAMEMELAFVFIVGGGVLRLAPRSARSFKLAWTPPTPITLKLLVDTKAKRVLFAEAGKDAVDFLLALLTLPVGTVAKLLPDSGVANIYASAESLDPAYVQSAAVHGALLRTNMPLLLRPCSYTTAPPRRQRLGTLAAVAENGAVTYYGAGYGGSTSSGGGGGGGIVRGAVTYTVMDDLTVAPMSNISCMALISKLNGEDKGLVVEEKSVQIGYQEGVEILKASLRSKTVLTDVFLSGSGDDDDVLVSKNKRARSDDNKDDDLGEEKTHNKIPDYYL
ncbi:hypothetical protein BRADI_2g00456v3 [Brachypodium distachyon]|uniref:Uncharacterized protein n=1 Tax=Brachypodium distachyon TaxID=15368 RepID=A0A0Q3I8Z0_BRADI|nr:hypothetical protein BRADI_2g00456v3 [Brachypodium distachyon]